MRVERSQAEGFCTVPIFAFLITDGGAFYSTGANITMTGRVTLQGNRAESRGGENMSRKSREESVMGDTVAVGEPTCILDIRILKALWTGATGPHTRLVLTLAHESF